MYFLVSALLYHKMLALCISLTKIACNILNIQAKIGGTQNQQINVGLA